MNIIDCHTHPFLTDDDCYCFYKGHTHLTPDSFREVLIKAGITHVCGSVISSVKYEEKDGFSYIKRLNDKALELLKIYGDFYTPGFHIHPGFYNESVETIEFMHDNGFKLIGELVPYMHGWGNMGFDYGSDELEKILDVAEKYNMILSYHTMNDKPDAMDKMIEEHPGLTFIAAHPGEPEIYKRQIGRLKKFDNLYLDLSGTGMFRFGMLREGVCEVGSEKLLFGTDFPIVNPKMYVEALRGEEISEEDLMNIYYKNAEKIFGLGK